jgi:hypothetical protein
MRNKVVAVVVAGAVAVLTAQAVASADQPPAKTFLAVLSAAEEVPTCAPATNAARGVAVFHVVDEASGQVDYKLVSNNLPGDIIAAHIHLAPPGVAGPIVQGLALTPGAENGVIATGSFTNAALVGAIRANPGAYYVNVHTAPPQGCASGVIRGQLDDRGPLNN